jgi:hypothetical protein
MPLLSARAFFCSRQKKQPHRNQTCALVTVWWRIKIANTPLFLRAIAGQQWCSLKFSFLKYNIKNRYKYGFLDQFVGIHLVGKKE